MYNDNPITFGDCTQTAEEGCDYNTFGNNIHSRIVKGSIYEIVGDDNRIKKLEDIMSDYEVLDSTQLEYLR